MVFCLISSEFLIMIAPGRRIITLVNKIHIAISLLTILSLIRIRPSDRCLGDVVFTALLTLLILLGVLVWTNFFLFAEVYWCSFILILLLIISFLLLWRMCPLIIAIMLCIGIPIGCQHLPQVKWDKWISCIRWVLVCKISIGRPSTAILLLQPLVHLPGVLAVVDVLKVLAMLRIPRQSLWLTSASIILYILVVIMGMLVRRIYHLILSIRVLRGWPLGVGWWLELAVICKFIQNSIWIVVLYIALMNWNWVVILIVSILDVQKLAHYHWVSAFEILILKNLWHLAGLRRASFRIGHHRVLERVDLIWVNWNVMSWYHLDLRRVLRELVLLVDWIDQGDLLAF